MDKPASETSAAAAATGRAALQAGADFAAELPERPALAPGFELLGEMRETGFVDRQCLIRRDGRFVQLTELLYRILERADGERTLEEIAAG